VAKLGFTPEAALQIGTQIHTAPEAFGKVMSTILVSAHTHHDILRSASVHAQAVETGP